MKETTNNAKAKLLTKKEKGTKKRQNFFSALLLLFRWKNADDVFRFSSFLSKQQNNDNKNHNNTTKNLQQNNISQNQSFATPSPLYSTEVMISSCSISFTISV